MDISEPKSNVKREAERAGKEVKPWVRRFGRLGRMAKGTVYSLIGVLTFMAALGIGGKATGTTGMLQSLTTLPFGEALLWLIGFGLFGYVTWMLVRAIKDPDGKGHDLKGFLSRTRYFISAIIYTTITISAIEIAVHAGRQESSTAETISYQLLSQPFGRWLVGLLGMIVIGYGLFQFYYGWKEKFIKKLKIKKMSDKEKKIVKIAGKIGAFSRGIIFSIIGYFFIRTAMTINPDKALGLDGALNKIAGQPFGQWLLGIISIGFMLYGIYQIFRGYYEQINFEK